MACAFALLREPQYHEHWVDRVAHFVRIPAYFMTWACAVLVITGSEKLQTAVRSPGKLAVVLIAGLIPVVAICNWDTFVHLHDFALIDRITDFGWQQITEPVMPGVATIAGWTTLLLTGSRTKCNDWLDWVGYCLGFIWIVYMIISPLFTSYWLRDTWGITAPMG